MGTLVYSDLAGAVEDAVDVIAKTRAREAGSLCEANIIVLTDSETVDSSDIADIQAAVGALSTASQVVDPDAADASGHHVFVVHVVPEETSEDPVLEALKCVVTGVSVQASPSPNYRRQRAVHHLRLLRERAQRRLRRSSGRSRTTMRVAPVSWSRRL